jgi:hypothetical protein
MNAIVTNTWLEANQCYLSAALAVVRDALEQHIENSQGSEDTDRQEKVTHLDLKEAGFAMPAPPALNTLCITFGLSPFEREVLLLCAGIELDSTFASLCARVHGDPQKNYPTFSLALAALPEPHWSALTPAAPLRCWRLIEVGKGSVLTLSPLYIDERVLHYLAGMQHLDKRLASIVEPYPMVDDHDLVPSHRTLADRITATWSDAEYLRTMPIVQLCGNETAGKRAIAVAVCRSLGLNLHVISAHFIPTGPAELDALIRLCEREVAMSRRAFLLDCDEVDKNDGAREKAIDKIIERFNSPLIITSQERRHTRYRSIITFDVHKPSASEQREIWEHGLGMVAASLNGRMDSLVSQFTTSAQTIHSACAEVSGRISSDDTMSQDDLVLPQLQKQILQEITMHVRQRLKVYNNWGFAAKSSQGLGISALFAGSSGTGKTMAAEVLANELKLDLYRIDLSQVVSKYIGETEKNLRRVFDVAEEGGAILLFDEADALFGRRSEVKDSHDRYANIEVSYLLQRMEAYRGLAILTTNMKDALDTAFLRRIRFIVQFPFPDVRQRVEIWKRIFPADTPTEGLDVNMLARLNVAGGNIKNIALYAAFLADEADESVRMAHLLRAARSEYVKLERPMTEAEMRGWV